MRGEQSKIKRKKAYERGLWAENLASLYLMAKGYRILKHRYKTRYGEIDLIAKKGDVIAFVEVKARKTAEDALYAINERSQIRIQKAALNYVSEELGAMDAYTLRFDVVTVVNERYKLPSIAHLENAIIL